MPLNRRSLMCGGALLGLRGASPRWMRAQRTAGKPANLYVTSTAGEHAAQAPLRWTAAVAAEPGARIEVDTTHAYQTILGFGAALTDASLYLLSKMPVAARDKFLNEMYSAAGLNLNIGRCCIGASDYGRSVYSYDDVADDMNLEHFSLQHDQAYILPLLREIRQIRPELFLLASPWSPPGWMKTYGTSFGGRTTENYLDPYAHSLWNLANGSMIGGWMSEKYIEVYSRYILKFLRGYAQAGVAVDAVTTQNEIMTTQHGTMPACRWSPLVEAAFVRDHLGPMLRAQHGTTQIWLFDHNYDLYPRVLGQLEDKQLIKYVDGVAWHGYTGTPDQMSVVHAKDPAVAFYWTEGGPFIDDPAYATDWAKWGGIFTDVLENWCRCAITWNLMLDARGKPNLGPYTCGGLVTLNDDGTIVKSGQYYALRHFSQHIQRDAVRLASTSNVSGIRHLAVRNPDGAFALVLTNAGEGKDLRILAAGQQLSLTLPGNCVATLRW